jgi:hypothetical protein
MRGVGAAARNLEKLTLFRKFYVIVIGYLYFTRIVVFMMQATLPFRTVWVAKFFEEIATLGFFVVAGCVFLPLQHTHTLSAHSFSLLRVQVSVPARAAKPVSASGPGRP